MPRLRPIVTADDPAIATLIRTVMPEFGAKGPGFAINDPEVDHMTEAYSGPRSRYWVVDAEGRVVGGGGFAQLTGADSHTCELRKMSPVGDFPGSYFLPETRGTGLGKQLLELCMAEAKRVGYTRMYLETLENMHAARRLYAAFGFSLLRKPKGATGHFGCDAWYERDL